MLMKWAKVYIKLFMIIIIFSKFTSPWAHYEKRYTGGCKSTHHTDTCPDLGEHAYKGELIDEPAKGPRFYIDDLEPFNENYLSYGREKRSSKKKESKGTPNDSVGHKDYYEEDEDDDEDELEDEKVEKPVKKGADKKKGKKKKFEEKEEKEVDDVDDEEEEDEANDESEEAENKEDENQKESDKVKET